MLDLVDDAREIAWRLGRDMDSQGLDFKAPAPPVGLMGPEPSGPCGGQGSFRAASCPLRAAQTAKVMRAGIAAIPAGQFQVADTQALFANPTPLIAAAILYVAIPWPLVRFTV